MIRTLAIGILSMFILPAMLACDKLPDPVVPDPPQEDQNEGKVNNDNSGGTDNTMPETIKIIVSGKTLSVKIEDNEATKALVAALREASITYEANDYGGFEKVGLLGRTRSYQRHADYHAGRGMLSYTAAIRLCCFTAATHGATLAWARCSTNLWMN
jgi:hypothetical protein